ncbi:MAG: serine hydrolase domain-containing protein [SAR202 cluster bacterium]|nr:serine hydrolase domain-containing protein [SAR202 cluster bacterium]
MQRDSLDWLLSNAVERGYVPGVVVVVATRESVLYRGAFGKLADDPVIDMTADAIFPVASMTKPVTSVGVMMLREQGLIDLDDAVSEYLPEFEGKEVIAGFDESDASYTTRPATTEVTIRHLMTHTAGFGYGFSSPIVRDLSRGAAGLGPREFPLLHDPGSKWTYGTSTRVLGWVIEKIAAEPLDAFFDSRILAPLGMTDTGFGLKSECFGRLVAQSRRVGATLVTGSGQRPPSSHVFGDAGLFSTADDYMRFVRMLLNGGELDGVRLLAAESVNEMITNQIGTLMVERQPGAMPERSRSFPLGAGRDKWGLGFQLKVGAEDGSRPPGSYSWAGIHNTHFWGDPHNGIGVVMLTRVLPFYDEGCIRLLTDLERRVYQNLE